MASFACCMYIRQKICPEEEMFTDLELEDIRLDRVSEKERTILGKINKMKVKKINLSLPLPSSFFSSTNDNN